MNPPPLYKNIPGFENLGEIRCCPFCSNPDVTPAEWFPGEPRFSVVCEQCGAIGPWHGEIHAAVKSWNIRLTSDAQTAALSKLTPDRISEPPKSPIHAAAPELLEACLAVYNDPYTTCACADKVRAAIAKATGNQ